MCAIQAVRCIVVAELRLSRLFGHRKAEAESKRVRIQHAIFPDVLAEQAKHRRGAMSWQRALAVTLLVARPRVKMPPRKIGAERCESGRIDMLGKHASQQWDRGFESHPLRQLKT